MSQLASFAYYIGVIALFYITIGIIGFNIENLIAKPTRFGLFLVVTINIVFLLVLAVLWSNTGSARLAFILMIVYVVINTGAIFYTKILAPK